MAYVKIKEYEILVEKGMIQDTGTGTKWVNDVLEINLNDVLRSKFYENAEIINDWHGASTSSLDSRHATTEEILNGLMSVIMHLNDEISLLKEKG